MSSQGVKNAPAKEEASTGTAQPTSPHALVFVLDTVAVDGRSLLFQELKKALDGKGVKLTPELFIRFCLSETPMFFMEPLLESAGAETAEAGDLAREVQAAYEAAVAGAQGPVRPVLASLIQEARKRGMAVTALTALEEDAARELMARLGWGADVIRLCAFPNHGERGFPKADAWLRAVKSLRRESRYCVAAVSSQLACKSALAADLLCVAIPDDFTSFQDYGGANAVVDDPKAFKPGEFIDELFARP